MSEATSNAPLTVVLVHGAFADSSSWDGVIERLQAAGIQVTASPNPLRGPVFIAAFAPDEGERLGEVTAGSRDSVLGTAQIALQYPTPDGARTATEFAIDPAMLHDVFAAELPAQQAAVMAATQRSVSELAFIEPSGPPAWKSAPSWTAAAVLITSATTSGREIMITCEPLTAVSRPVAAAAG
jgi:hypothetical protein